MLSRGLIHAKRGARLLAIFCVGSGIVATATACEGTSPARAVRPKAPTAVQALEEGRCGSSDDAPLVVDWPAHRRAELEASVRGQRVILATYDCRKLRLLFDCRADGIYEYQRVTPKTDIVRMTDTDSVRARLPTMGAALAIELEGSLARGSSLDLGFVTTGRWTASSQAVYAKSLSPVCQSATHFVRTVPTGAFAMSVGSRAEVRAVAEIFDAGARAESASARVRDVRDGDLAACQGSPTGQVPPSGCAVPIRVELQKIDPRSLARAKCEDMSEAESCFLWSREVLTPQDGKIDAAQVEQVLTKLFALCRARSGLACATAHFNLRRADVHARRSEADLRWLAERGCSLGERHLCLDEAYDLEAEGKTEEAYRMLQLACETGGHGCSDLADSVAAGAGSMNAGQRRQYVADLRARACQSASDQCDRYAASFGAGLRARGDFSRMQRHVARCDDSLKKSDGSSDGCLFAAAAHAFGLGVPRNLARAKQAYARQCADPMVVQTLRGGTCSFPKDWQ